MYNNDAMIKTVTVAAYQLPSFITYQSSHHLRVHQRTTRNAINHHRNLTMKFRPCIDLHSGQVKQIVGSTLSDDKQNALTATQSSVEAENFSTDKPASDFAVMYKDDGLTGGHVIMLGPGNQDAVRCYSVIDKNLC